MNLAPYLATSPFIDHGHPAVTACAAELAADVHSQHDLVRRCFEFVRDEIRHSSDFRLNPVTCRASDVLQHGTGFCYAKSHLLAALLRANGVPAGLCYQRLSIADGGGGPYCLHGLNAVLLAEHGWFRIDARGNKPGVDAGFAPPQEILAFPVRPPMERDLPEIWAEPLPCVTDVLQSCDSYDEVLQRLPDVPLIAADRGKSANGWPA